MKDQTKDLSEAELETELEEKISELEVELREYKEKLHFKRWSNALSDEEIDLLIPLLQKIKDSRSPHGKK